jgi:hypothetical protein
MTTDEVYQAAKKSISMKWIAIIILSLAAILILLSLVYIDHSRHKVAKPSIPSVTLNKSSAGSSQSTKATINTATSTKSSTGTKTNAATATAPDNPACNLLKPAIARTILGSSAEYTTPPSTSAYEASDTTLSACSYANSSGLTLQVIVRTPTASLGDSENDTEFGSGKPTNVVSVQSFGQAAFWDTDSNQLDILSSNTWYIISGEQQGSPESMKSIESAASNMKSGF